MAGERDLGIGGIGQVDPIGRGGNAVVYRARELDHDRWVAVKVLLGLGGDSELRRFDRERRAMGRLSEHDGIVPIYSSGITEAGDPYLVMPLLPESLQDRLDDAGPNDWRDAAGLMVRVARTVEAAHRADVIHRDLKPSNILLTSGGAPLVADFGIAQLADSTASTAITLTPAYSPPEVFDGAAPSEGADIYALGATLFALIAGAPPFDSQEGENLFATMARVASQPIDELRPVGVPDVVWAVVERAMRKTPDERFRTADDFATALEQAVEESGRDDTPTKIVEDQPEASGEVAERDAAPTKFVEHQSSLSGSVGREQRVEPTANTTVSHPAPPVGETSTDDETRPPSSRRLWWILAAGVSALIAAVVIPTPGFGAFIILGVTAITSALMAIVLIAARWDTRKKPPGKQPPGGQRRR